MPYQDMPSPMQEIEAPDGVIYEFPAAMPDAEIARLIRKDMSARALEGIQQRSIANVSEMTAQDALDFAGSGLGAIGGAAAGTAFGAVAPVTVPALAAAGSVAGKRVARDIGSLFGTTGSEQYPGTAESVVDAAAGAAGPIIGSTSRALGRQISGISGELVEQTQQKLVPELKKAARDVAKAVPGTGSGRTLGRQWSNDAIEGAVNLTVKRAAQRGAAETALPGGIVGSVVSSVEPITGALIGAGVSHVVIRNVVPALLRSKFGPEFARWALNMNKGRAPDAAKSLLAIGIGQDMTRDERRALNAMADELRTTPASSRHSARDEKGRFVAIDRSQLESLFGGTP